LYVTAGRDSDRVKKKKERWAAAIIGTMRPAVVATTADTNTAATINRALPTISRPGKV
jgi:hypothetical protein